MRKIKLVLVSIVSLIIIFASCSAPGVGPQKGKTAPDFTLTSLNGEVVSLNTLTGKTVLLNFWASWCTPCCYEMPFLQEIFEEHSANGLIVLGVNSWEDRNTIKEFANTNEFTFPLLIDYPSQEVAQSYQIVNIPATFVIDKKGTIKAVKIGSFNDKAEIESLLK